MKRIVIIGNGGAGKSTLALSLSSAIKVPVYHLDQIIWRENWQAISETEFSQQHKELLVYETWIIEGVGYDSSFEERFDASDTIIYIDLPIFILLIRAIKRAIKSPFIKPKGWAEGCKLLSKLPFTINIMLDIHKNTRNSILELMRKYEAKKIYHIKSVNQLKMFYVKYCGT